MRKVKESMPNLNIVHRSFALVEEEKDFDYMFGSQIQAKEEVLKHWKHANETDPLRRFNIEGMRKADFLFPVSMPALCACKAAYLISDDSGYWDLFDKLQDNFFVKNLNIQEDDVIYKAVKETNLNFEQWKEMYHSPKSREAVYKDFALVEKYKIQEVPTLVINEKYKIKGSLPVEELIKKIKNIM